MDKDQKEKLEKLRWENERKLKQKEFNNQLQKFLKPSEYKFLSFEESDNIQTVGDDWPSNKWDDELYLQVELNQKEKISNLVNCYLELTTDNNCYIFSMNYNFGLTQLDKKICKLNWSNLIEVDKDEIFIFLPGKTEFLCIEKTVDKIVGKENEGFKWIYEATFSTKVLKDQIGKNCT